MMYNVAYFMLPPTKPAVAAGAERHLRRDRGHWIAHVLLRLLAMAATVQFVTAAATVTIEHGGLAGGWGDGESVAKLDGVVREMDGGLACDPGHGVGRRGRRRRVVD